MNVQRLLSSDTSSPLSKVIPKAFQHTRTPSLSSVVSVDQSSDPVPPAHVDPHVVAFLKKHLADTKWRIFSSRLCERRSINAAQIGNGGGGGNHNKAAKKREEGSVVIDQSQSPCAIEFLVKVEVVKEVLRQYVPHPYHPQKTLEHRWEGAPGGQVHITRTTVLALSGWSNTQFAYWARRSEAVSVLARHDHRLRDLACVLYQRLYNRHLPPDAFAPSSPGSSHAPSSSASSSGCSPSASPVSSLATFVDADEPERQLQVAKLFTGKGLDGAIADVKKRTGASQFLRGRQSSLDAFGSNFDCQSPPSSIVDLSIGTSSSTSSSSTGSRPSLGASPFTFLGRRDELDPWSLRGSATSPLPTPAFSYSTWSTRTSDAGGSGSSSPSPAHHHRHPGSSSSISSISSSSSSSSSTCAELGRGQDGWMTTARLSLKRKYRPSEEDRDEYPPPPRGDRDERTRPVSVSASVSSPSSPEPAFKRMKIDRSSPPRLRSPPDPKNCISDYRAPAVSLSYVCGHGRPTPL